MVSQKVPVRVGGRDKAKSEGREVRKEDMCDILEMGQGEREASTCELLQS